MDYLCNFTKNCSPSYWIVVKKFFYIAFIFILFLVRLESKTFNSDKNSTSLSSNKKISTNFLKS